MLHDILAVNDALSSVEQESWNVTQIMGIKDFEGVARLDGVKNCFSVGVKWQRDTEWNILTIF